MFEDYCQRQHIATWNNVRGVWETDQVSLLCGHSALFSETWPASGMMQSGQAYELQMLAHPTTGSGYLSLPTPAMPTITTNGTGRHSASYDSLGTLQMLEVSKGILPREYSSWDEINSKIPIEWRDGRALPIPEESMFRTPQAKEGEGGAIFEDVKRDRGNHVMVRDQVAQLAMENGLPVSEGLTDALLPTVKARDASPEGYEAGLRRGMPQLGTMVKAIVDGDDRLDLLPTPQAMEGAKGNNLSVADRAATGQVMLSNYAVEIATSGPAIFNSGEVLLGTPRTSSANSPSSKEVENGAVKARLEDQVRSANEGYISWGKFEPAIRRWEQVLGRPAPSPTLPDGKDGNHRLSAFFTEWMMGLEPGHVTNPELGLSRVEMLKLCGNGVVPQQAELALRMLLEGTMPFTNTQVQGEGMSMFPTPTVSDIYTGDLKSSQQKEGLMHSVTLPQAVKWIETKETK